MRPLARHRRELHHRASRDLADLPQAADHRVDPRRIVVLVAIAALGLAFAASAVLYIQTHRTKAKVRHLVTSIEPPKDHLLAAERANDSGQAALAAAVASSGEVRTALLSQSIVYAQETSSEWAKYRTSAAALPGEDELAKKFLADQARARIASTAAVVPILKSSGPDTLPKHEIDIYNAARGDLIKLHSLYRVADRRLFAQLERDFTRFDLTLAIGSAFALLLVVVGSVIGMQKARKTVRDRSARVAVTRLTAFEGRLRRALELIHNDNSAFEVAERAAGGRCCLMRRSVCWSLTPATLV